ncbi:MAG: hypothetical protein ACYTFQ_05670 [Planctomycetota bacterium]|jgi:hypothetical protein
MRCGNNTVAVLDSCRFILKIVNILHWNVITAKVAVEYGFESVHIPRIWVRLIQAGVSTLDRHAVNKLKRRVRVTTFYPLTPVGLVDALGNTNLITELSSFESILQMYISIRPVRTTSDSGAVGVHVYDSRHS